ncbi:MAG: ferrous iron transport protein B [Phycisphaerales bacterium]
MSASATPSATDGGRSGSGFTVALLGNPNVGKTTVFNRLCGVRHHTSNFPGTTQEARVGDPGIQTDPPAPVRLIDLPGIYELELNQGEAELCRSVLDGQVSPDDAPAVRPDAVLVVVDATNLERNLVLTGQAIAGGHRLIVALNMIDEAERRGLSVDAERLALALGVPVIPTCARAGTGIDALRRAVAAVVQGEQFAAGSADTGVADSPMSSAAGSSTDSSVDSATDSAFRGATRPVPPRDLPVIRSWAKAVAGDAFGSAASPAHADARSDATASEDAHAASSGRTDPSADQPRSEPAAAAAGGAGGGTADDAAEHIWTDRFDGILTHPIGGLIVFLVVMTGLFAVIFRLAAYPMEWIDAGVGGFGGWVATVLPPGLLNDLLVDGVIAGIGATVIFLPQICLLFFLLSLLEDTGYLARASLFADRWLRPFGLSGHAFVPLLSAHACALPAIAAARGVPDARARLATILVAPFMSCTARIPVYVLLTVLLFPGRPLAQGVAFTGCYVLGALAGLFSAWIARRTVARGPGRPITLELPVYRWPSLRSALLTMWDRGLSFLRKAGTVILLISIVLWWLATFPRSGPSPEAEAIRADVAALTEAAAADGSSAVAVAGDAIAADTEARLAEADSIDARFAAQRTALGRLGAFAEPAFAPLGYDRTLTVGVLASFAAREVFVTTMAVQVLGRDELEDDGVFATLKNATRDDGVTPIFTPATSWSLLVYYVLAMQCLPTLVLTAREAGGWKWALLQLGWMCGLAWVASLAVYQVLVAVGAG